MKQPNNLPAGRQGQTIEPAHFEQLYPEDTRFEEIHKIIEIIRTGRACQVVGLPGVGKSNVLRLLPYNRSVREAHLGEDEKCHHFVYMDFSEVKQRSISDVLKFILISFSHSLSERGLVIEQNVVSKYFKEALSFPDELIFSEALKKSIDYLTKEKDLHVVLLLDRFDEYIPNIDANFFNDLKILRNRAKYHFSTVFGVERPIEDVVEPQIFADFYEFLVGNIVFLPLNDSVGLSFRFKHLEEVSGKSVRDTTKKEIVKLTGGHVKLSRIAYEAILGEEQKGNLLEFLLSKAAVRGALFEISNFLTPEEKNDIKKGDINEFLEKIGLTKNGKITIPLFEAFLKTLTPQTSPKITYDPNRNEIIKGEENLTEKLSPSEFRLLRFLLQNQGRVCEKDEIIQGVWKDTKTQEGVTDQALDQIIYRLRKKIEDEPENPRFIQTIKGRGYKVNK